MSNINQALVNHVAHLAQIPVTEDESTQIAQAFIETLAVVDELQELDTSTVEPTHQVTGLKNILREDVVIPSQSFTQEEALANASRTYKGYLVVPKVIEK